jgi:hypothetical protein
MTHAVRFLYVEHRSSIGTDATPRRPPSSNNRNNA